MYIELFTYICVVIVLCECDGPSFFCVAIKIFISDSNYFPYRPETNLAFERDYKSYPEYETNAFHENRDLFVNSPSPTYLNYVRNIATMTQRHSISDMLSPTTSS